MAKRLAHRSVSLAHVFEDFGGNQQQQQQQPSHYQHEQDIDGCINTWLGTSTLPRSHGASESGGSSSVGPPRPISDFSDLQSEISNLPQFRPRLTNSLQRRRNLPASRSKSRGSCGSSNSSSGAESGEGERLEHGTVVADAERLAATTTSDEEEQLAAMYEELEAARAQLAVAGTCGSALLEDVRLLRGNNETLLKDKQQLQQDLENETKRYHINLKQARQNMEASVQQMEVELADSQSSLLCLREELRLAREELLRRDDVVGEMTEKVGELEDELSATNSPSVNGNSPVKRNRMRPMKSRSFKFHGARRAGSNASQQSDGSGQTSSTGGDTCEIGIQTDKVEAVCKESECPFVKSLKAKHTLLIDDLRDELQQTNDYAMRRRKQARDLQDELQECRKQLQEFVSENTDLRDELEDRVTELRQINQGCNADDSSPGMSLLTEMDTFRFPASVVKTVPMHQSLAPQLSTVSEADSRAGESVPPLQALRSPGDGACLAPCSDVESIRESTKELSQLRDDIQAAINKLNSSLSGNFVTTKQANNDILFDPKQPLKLTTSLPSHLALVKKGPLQRMTSEPSPMATEQHCKLSFDLEVLHLKETVKELVATAVVMATVNQNANGGRPRLTKTQSVDPINVVTMAMTTTTTTTGTQSNRDVPHPRPNSNRARFVLHKAHSQLNCRDKKASPLLIQRSKSNTVSSQQPVVDDRIPLSIFKYRLSELENELNDARLETGRLEFQLLEAVKQKMTMAEQIDDWQSDMECVIVERIQEQASRDRTRVRPAVAVETPASPKRRRLSLANLLAPASSRDSTPSPSRASRREPRKPARAFESDGSGSSSSSSSFRNTDFWVLSGRGKDGRKASAMVESPRTAIDQAHARGGQQLPSPSSTAGSPHQESRRSPRPSLARPSSFVDPLSPVTPSRRKSSGLAFPKWIK